MNYNAYYNAKLLLTAEYLVLNGARALALPLIFGQRLQVIENEQGFISWQSVSHDGSDWFTAKYDLPGFRIIESSNPETAVHPQRLLRAAKILNPDFCLNSAGCHVVSTLNYPLLWGLGSSSTLIAAIAGWAAIDPYKLHFSVSKGSGYDIACAVTNKPLIYTLKDQNPEVESIFFSPAFADQIFFVYQGRKQDSDEGITIFKNRNSRPDSSIIAEASKLTNRMLHAPTLSEFEQVLHDHEILISQLLAAKPLRERLFNDLPGEVKSLGAWGGDFCMLTWHEDLTLLPAYLKSKQLETWFNFNEIVL